LNEVEQLVYAAIHPGWSVLVDEYVDDCIGLNITDRLSLHMTWGSLEHGQRPMLPTAAESPPPHNAEERAGRKQSDGFDSRFIRTPVFAEGHSERQYADRTAWAVYGEDAGERRGHDSPPGERLTAVPRQPLEMSLPWAWDVARDPSPAPEAEKRHQANSAQESDPRKPRPIVIFSSFAVFNNCIRREIGISAGVAS
jgi:hypothetical protein